MRVRLFSRRLGPIGLAVLVVLGVAAAAGLFYVLFVASIHAYLPDSDSATPVLEAKAMLHGHPALSGWAISLDSFWLVDTLWYMLGVALFGIHPFLMHAIPALIGTFVVILGVVMAVEGRRRWAAVAAGGVVVAVLGLPSQAWATFFLRGPWHVGTALWALVAFYALRRGRFGWGFAVAIVFMAAGMLGDLQMAALGVGPLFVAGLFAMARLRSWRGGIAQVVAALGAAALAEGVRHLARVLGTFSIAPANPHASVHQMFANIKHGLHEGVLLLGAGGTYYGLGGTPAWLSYFRFIAVVLVGIGVLFAIGSLIFGAVTGRETAAGGWGEGAWRLDDMLVLGALGGFAAFCYLALVGDPIYARYLIAPVIFSTIVAARAVGRVAGELPRGAIGSLLGAAGLAVAGLFAAGVGLDLAQPAPVPPTGTLAGFLAAHGLDHGVGAYWSASIVTLESSDRVQIRPVVTVGGKVVRYDRNSAGYWYDRPFNYLVYDTSLPWGGVDSQTAAATFGPPVKTYTVAGHYKVLVWSKPFRISPKR